MNDKQQLAAIGEHLAEQAEQAAQPLCMAKRIEELEALLREARDMMDNQPRGFSGMMRRIDEALDCMPAPASSETESSKIVWRNTGSSNGLRRFMTHKQYDAQTPGVQKWYEPIRHEVPEGWQLVPAVPTEEMCEAGANAPLKVRQAEVTWIGVIYRAMLSAAPSPGTTK